MLCHAAGAGGRVALNLFIQLCSQLLPHCTIPASPQNKPKAQLIVCVEGELPLPHWKSPAADLHHKPPARSGDSVHHSGGKVRINNRVMFQDLAARQLARIPEQGNTCRRARSARRSVHLPVGKNTHIALRQPGTEMFHGLVKDCAKHTFQP